MKWEIAGRLAGACNCATPCPCWFNENPTRGSCDAIGVGLVDEGHYGDISLEGCRFGVAYRTVTRVWDGGLQAAVYLDERTPGPQTAALERILTGKAGGLLELLFTLVADFKGIRRVPIDLDDTGAKPVLTLGRASVVTMSPVIGRDGKNPIAVSNAMMSFGGIRNLAKTAGRFIDDELGWEWPLEHSDFGPMRLSSG
jgi:hypothetical protein